jgi:hypothetical protein
VIAEARNCQASRATKPTRACFRNETSSFEHAVMNKNRNLAQLCRQIDAFCQKMNSGLSAIALVLAICVMIMGIVRSSQVTAATLSTGPFVQPNAVDAMGWNGTMYF